MHDAGVGRNDGEVGETGLAPAEERVAFFVALELEQSVHFESVGGAELVYLNRVVDDQFYRLQRVDQRGIATESFHCVAHGSKVDYAGDAGEILKKNAAGRKSDFFFRLRFAVPA